MPFKEVAGRLGIFGGTVSKYIAILEAEDKVACRVVGGAKLCRAKGEQIEE
jgi:Mn-dependent DtxR family transcriptional regulator